MSLAFGVDGVDFDSKEIRTLKSFKKISDPPADRTNFLSQNSQAISVGAILFRSPTLSLNGRLSCESCHRKSLNYGDSQTTPHGLGLGTRNTPSIVGLAGDDWFFWDGRADSLWSQVASVLTDPSEMGSSPMSVVAAVRGDRALIEMIDEMLSSGAGNWKSFDALANADNNAAFVVVGKAIAAFVETLKTKPTRFDVFLSQLDEPHKSSLSVSELRGLRTFIGEGNCINCHSGPRFSDGHFHNIGIPPDLSKKSQDPGRFVGFRIAKNTEFSAAGKYSDDPEYGASKIQRAFVDHNSWSAFKTPSLRSVSKNAPYMHDGRFPDLASVVEFYSELPGGNGDDHHANGVLRRLDLSETEKQDLVAFLNTL